MKRMNIIGAGHVGQSLGRLWSEAGLLKIGEVLNTSLESAKTAAAFMQAGTAIDSIESMQEADIYCIGCPDTYIESCCERLSSSDLLVEGAIVFHCSGALRSELLLSAKTQGAYIASLHPVKSFAEPASVVEQFSGAYCALEGDEVAVSVLSKLIERIEARPFRIDPAHKAIYHAASVMACNYLVALQEVSIQALNKAGVDRVQAMQILHPLVAGTVNNIFAQGTVDALSGPIARGDRAVVEHQLTALQAWQPDLAQLYQQLGLETVKLARQQGKLDSESLDRIDEILGS